MARQVYYLAHEGLVNAARHADASSAELWISASDGGLQVSIRDNGHGFPVHGRHDLASLEILGIAPVRLARRVEGLRGTLVIESAETGSRLDITLPVGSG